MTDRTETTPDHRRRPARSITREIADAVAGLTRDRTGRGPVHVRTIVEGDVVVVLMNDAFTRAEQTLLENGRAAEVLDFRRAFQDVMRPAYSEAVERITGRKVRTFMSSNHTEPDHAAEIFLLDGPVAG